MHIEQKKKRIWGRKEMKTCHTPYGSEGVEEKDVGGGGAGGCIHIGQKKKTLREEEDIHIEQKKKTTQ